MSKSTNLPDEIHKVIRIYNDRVICPAVMWHMVAQAIEESETKLLYLPNRTIKLLLKCKMDRPNSLESVAKKMPVLKPLQKRLSANSLK